MVTYTNEQVLLQGPAKSLTNSQMFGSLDVQGQGSGYTSAPSVSITGGGGSGATATSKLKVTRVETAAAGSGYTSVPQIGFSGGGGSGAQAQAVIDGGQVKAINVTNGGSNYTSVPSVSITGGGGSGASAQAIMSVERIDLGQGGSGYTSDPAVTISAPPAGGVTAKAYAKTNGSSVESIYIAGDMSVLKNSSYLTFLDSTNNVASEMFVLTSSENGNSPILSFTQGVMIEKDLMVGGFLDSGQGALWLNYGLYGRPELSSPPCIQLMSSWKEFPFGTNFPDPGPRGYEKGQLFNLTSGCTWSGIYYSPGKYMWNGSYWGNVDLSGYYDTLFLFKYDGITPANMVMGDLTVHGLLNMSDNSAAASIWKIIIKGDGLLQGSSLMRTAVAQDASASLPAESPQLVIESDNATIQFSDDCKLYRAVKDEVVALETDNGFIAPAIDANQLVINQDAHIVGSLELGTSPAAINFTTGYTTSEGTTYRYLIPDGADKTVGIGSVDHYLAYVSANRVYTNEVLSLDAGYTIIGSALNANGSVGTAGQVLTSRGAGLSPQWSNETWNGGTVTNNITIQNSNPTIQLRTTGNNAEWIDFYNSSGARQWLIGMGITGGSSINMEFYPYNGGSLVMYSPVSMTSTLTVGGDLFFGGAGWLLHTVGTTIYLGKQGVTNGLSIDVSGNGTFAGGLTVNGGLTLGTTGITINTTDSVKPSIYWQTATNPNAFEVNKPVIIDSSLQVGNGLSVTGPIGATTKISSGYQGIHVGMYLHFDHTELGNFPTIGFNAYQTSVSGASHLYTPNYPYGTMGLLVIDCAGEGYEHRWYNPNGSYPQVDTGSFSRIWRSDRNGITLFSNSEYSPLNNNSGAVRLHCNADQVLQVQNTSGQLAILDVSILFADRLNSATGGGIYICDTLRPYGSSIIISGRVDSDSVIHGGGGSGDAFQVGDDCYLVDINYANRIGVQGAEDRSQGGFEFGSGTGMFLYRDGGYLRSSAGFVTSGNLSCSPVNTSYRACYLDSSNRIGYNMSSAKFKNNVNTVEDCSWLYNLRPVTFDWKDSDRAKVEGTQIGLIAEEVNELCPKLTWLDNEGKPEGVHYEWLGVPIIVELKKLRKEVTDLRSQLQKLTAKRPVSA